VIVGVVSVAVALTLLPAMLSLIGDRVNSLRLPIVGKNLGRSDAAQARVWRAVTGRVMRRPAVSLALAGGFMLLAAVPLLGLHIGQSGVTTLPANLPSKQGYLAVQRYFPGQSQDPVEIVSVGETGTARADFVKLEAVLAGDPRFGPGIVQPSSDGKILTLTVPIRGDVVSSQDVAAVLNLRQQLIPSAFADSGAQVYVGGKTADEADSILLNLLSVGGAYGLLTLVFIHGAGAGIFGFQKVPAIDAWVPLFMFSVLFALSMDYQVFLMSRIKERYDQYGSTREAVAGSVASTAKIITGAALIIVAVFAGFARGQLLQFQEMGFGVAAALILDATLIRLVILPSTLSLLGQHSWYLPRWLDWLPRLQVEPPEAPSSDETVALPVRL
jgi:RND superfamily putative drug exporter